MAWESIITGTYTFIGDIKDDPTHLVPTNFSKYRYKFENKHPYYAMYLYAKPSDTLIKTIAPETTEVFEWAPVNGMTSFYAAGITFLYPYRELKNTAPTTPGAFTNPTSGTTLKAGNVYTVSFGSSTDVNGDSLTYQAQYRYIQNGVPSAWNSLQSIVASTNRSISVASNPINSHIEFQVRAFDGIEYSSYRMSERFLISYNTAPTVTPKEAAPSGAHSVKPSFDYIVSDADGNAMTITESIDGIVFNTRTAIASGTTLKYTPSDLAWLRTRINQTVNLTITVDDGNGGLTTVNYPITRTSPAIDLRLKTPFETDVAAKRILLNIEGEIANDAIVTVQACNNAFDVSPTWEDATRLVLKGLPYLFSNKTKTATKWGVSFKIKVERGSSTGLIYIDGIGGAFD